MITIIVLVLFAGMQADKYLENDFPGFIVFIAFLRVVLSLYIALVDFVR